MVWTEIKPNKRKPTYWMKEIGGLTTKPKNKMKKRAEKIWKQAKGEQQQKVHYYMYIHYTIFCANVCMRCAYCNQIPCHRDHFSDLVCYLGVTLRIYVDDNNKMHITALIVNGVFFCLDSTSSWMFFWKRFLCSRFWLFIFGSAQFCDLSVSFIIDRINATII